MFKGFIFDVDGTLYSYKANDKIATHQLCKYAQQNFNLDEEKFRAVYTEARRIVKEERLTDGGARHSRVLFFQTVLELLGKNPFNYTLKMYNVYWDNFLKQIQPFDGVIEFLSKIKNCGGKIALCTDMTAHIQYRKIEKLGLSNFIDYMVSSEETGQEKPSPAMFNLALKKLNVEPNETAYFGDSPERDIVGAASLGIKPFWFLAEQRGEDLKLDCVKFKSYREIFNLIDNF